MSESILTRLYLDQPLSAGAAVVLGDGQTHRLRHVLRAGKGDAVALFNGRDGEWLAVLSEASAKAVRLRVLRQHRPPEPAPEVWLLFAPIRRNRMDWLIEKAVELGVGRLLPVLSRRTVVRKLNLERARARIIEALEQSEQLNLPEIAPPRPLDALMADWPADRALLFCDVEARGDPAVAPLIVAGLKIDGPAALLIGPEGGFEPDERAMLRAHPAATPVSLGPSQLRSETAALVALSHWHMAANARRLALAQALAPRAARR